MIMETYVYLEVSLDHVQNERSLQWRVGDLECGIGGEGLKGGVLSWELSVWESCGDGVCLEGMFCRHFLWDCPF